MPIMKWSSYKAWMGAWPAPGKPHDKRFWTVKAVADSSGGLRWKEPAVIIGAISLIIAFLAFGRDLLGVELSPHAETTPAPSMTIARTPTSLGSTTPTVSSPAGVTADTQATGPSGLPLINLTPKVGGDLVRRRSGAEPSFTMACATNTDGDLYRAVVFDIPRRYATFYTRVAASSVVDDVRVDIRVDNLIRAGSTLLPNGPGSELSTALSGGATLELRLTCARPGGAVIFSNATMTR